MSGPSDKAPEASDTAPATSDTGPGQVGPDAAMASIRAARRALLGATHGVWPRYVSLNESTDLLEALHFAAAELEKLIAAEPVSRAMAAIVAVAVKRNAVAEEWARVTEEKGSDHQAYDVAANAFDAEDAALDDAVDAYLEAEKAARIQAGLMTADEIRRLEGAEPGGLLSGDVSDCTVEEVLQTIEEIRTTAPTAPSTFECWDDLLEAAARGVMEFRGWKTKAASVLESADENPRAREWVEEARAVLSAVGINRDTFTAPSTADNRWASGVEAALDVLDGYLQNRQEPEDAWDIELLAEIRADIEDLVPPAPSTAAGERDVSSVIARMERSPATWAGMVAHAVIGGSEAQVINAILDAKHDIALLVAALATPPAQSKNLCDCERSHNGLGMMGRECDCPAGDPPKHRGEYSTHQQQADACAALATPPAQSAPTLADRLLAAGVDLKRDKADLLALLRPDAVWPFDMREWSTETLSEALADANWMEPIAIQRGYVGAKVWAVRIPIGDSEGMVEDEEFRVFATEEAAKDYCRGAEEAQP